MKKFISKIPKFNNIAEEAEFWDTHDFGDYLDELKPANVVFALEKEPKLGITVKVSPDIKNDIKRIAKKLALAPSELLSIWISEKLEALNKPSKSLVLREPKTKAKYTTRAK